MDPSQAAPEHLSNALRRRRSFHRMGLGGAAVIRLELLELLRADTFSIVLGFSFVLLGVIAIAAYGMVRAIERLSR
jgi:hypothetical protein